MNIVIRKGTQEDTEELLTLFRDVQEGMAHPEWFCLDAPEEVRERMRDGTMQLWVAMDGERMAAAFDLLIPGLDDCNYGYCLGFSQEQLLQVVNMDAAAVHPDYRGLGLQRKLVQTAEETLRGLGKRILLCTVHPDNQYSLNNVLKQGYTIQKKVSIYDSVRYVLRKDIS